VSLQKVLISIISKTSIDVKRRGKHSSLMPNSILLL